MSPPDPAAQPAVLLDGVSRSFAGDRGVCDLTLEVATGTVTVLLGPNGAGKTTTVRLVTGALLPDEGTVRVFGLDPAVDGQAVRQRCGIVPPKPALYERLTGRENLRYAAALWDLGSRKAVEPMVTAAAERFGILDDLDRKVGGYSTGMRTRLALARAILPDPDLLLLDEPTAGLDPESARTVLSLVHDLARGGTTILLCTHLLHEAEGLADQVVLVHDGTAVVAGAPGELAEEVLPELDVVFDAEDPAALAMVADLPAVGHVEWHQARDVHRTGAVTARLTDPAALADVVAALVGAGVRLTRVDPRRRSLEDLYFALRTGPGVAEPRVTGSGPTSATTPVPVSAGRPR